MKRNNFKKKKKKKKKENQKHLKGELNKRQKLELTEIKIC